MLASYPVSVFSIERVYCNKGFPTAVSYTAHMQDRASLGLSISWTFIRNFLRHPAGKQTNQLMQEHYRLATRTHRDIRTVTSIYEHYTQIHMETH